MLPGNRVYKYLLEMLLWIGLAIYSEVELLNPMVVLFLWGTPTLFSKAAVPLAISTYGTQYFCFLHILTSKYVLGFL
jgi:hypothetical protein